MYTQDNHQLNQTRASICPHLCILLTLLTMPYPTFSLFSYQPRLTGLKSIARGGYPPPRGRTSTTVKFHPPHIAFPTNLRPMAPFPAVGSPHSAAAAGAVRSDDEGEDRHQRGAPPLEGHPGSGWVCCFFLGPSKAMWSPPPHKCCISLRLENAVFQTL